MKYLSVCSGIEAATVAWHGLGWEPVAFAEVEAFPSAVLAHHYPTVPNFGDLTKYRDWPEERLAEVELLVGGTPCQAFSVAGQRRSLDDERGNLSLIYVNLYHHINEVRRRHGRPPAIALWENVPGVLSTKDNAFGCFIGGLLGCDEAPATESGKWDKAGFLGSEAVRVGYRVLDAQYFGVAQRRRRVFLVAVPCELVASLGERACPSEILSLRESVLGNPPSRGAAWEGVARATASGLTSSGRGVERCGESRGQDDVVIDCGSVTGTLNSNGKAAGSATQQDAETGMLVAFGGNRSSGPLDVATSCLANASPHGRQDFASETFVACFHPTQDPISSVDGSAHAVSTGSSGGCATHAVCVTGQRSHALTTRAAACEEDGTGRGTPIVTHGAIAFKPGQSEAAGGTFVTDEFAPTVQAQNNGSTAVPAVAFVKATSPHSAEEAPRYEEASVAACLNGWDERHDPPKHMVAFAQNQLGEVRVNADVMGTVNQNQNASGRNTPMVATHVQFDRRRSPSESDVVNALHASDSGCMFSAVRTQMQVRRLTPTECAYLQGFPADYLDITFRKKPAADGPKYRALGNSMAVPCMWWLGHRIDKATRT